jgi:hypothetical protein
MDKLKITISGITNAFVGNITIRSERKLNVDSKFTYDKDKNYVGIFEHKIDTTKTNPMYIYITGQDGPCKCNVINDSKNIDYGTETREISNDGGVNFIFYL